jgi:DNA-binding CsgD family transcriptional regulator
VIPFEEIIEAALDDELFQSLPHRIAAISNSRSVLIPWHLANSDVQVMAHSGYFTDNQLETYATKFSAMDPWALASAGNQPDGRAINLEQLVATDEFVRSPFYNEYIRGMGDDTARCMGLRVNTNWGSGMIAVQRGLTQPTFSEAEVAQLDTIGRQLSRVIALRGRLEWYRHRLADAEAILSQLADAALLLEPSCRLITANPAGERLLSSGKLVVRQGRVALPHSSSLDAEFRTAVQRAAPPHLKSADLFTGEDGLVLSVSPLSHPAAPRILVLGKQRSEAPQRVRQRLQQAFKLSKSEAEVALLIAEGASLRTISEQRDVSVATVRVQLKAVFSKMGCSRQAEVVALIQSLPRLA